MRSDTRYSPHPHPSELGSGFYGIQPRGSKNNLTSRRLETATRPTTTTATPNDGCVGRYHEEGQQQQQRHHHHLQQAWQQQYCVRSRGHSRRRIWRSDCCCCCRGGGGCDSSSLLESRGPHGASRRLCLGRAHQQQHQLCHGSCGTYHLSSSSSKNNISSY